MDRNEFQNSYKNMERKRGNGKKLRKYTQRFYGVLAACIILAGSNVYLAYRCFLTPGKTEELSSAQLGAAETGSRQEDLVEEIPNVQAETNGETADRNTDGTVEATNTDSSESSGAAQSSEPAQDPNPAETPEGAAEQASPGKQVIDRFLDDNGITKEQLVYCVMPLRSGEMKGSIRNLDNLKEQTKADFGKMYIAGAVYQRLSEGTIYNGYGETDNFLKTHLLEMLGREDENAEMKEDFLKHSSKEAAKSLVGLLGYFDESHENPYENPRLKGDWENGYTEMQNYFDKNGFADTIMTGDTGDNKVFHCQTTVQDGMEFFRKMVVEGQESGQDPYKKNFRNLFQRSVNVEYDTSCSAVAQEMRTLSENNGKHCCWMSEKAGQTEDGSGEACEETFLAVVNDIYDSEASGFVLYTRIDESAISDEQQGQFVEKVYDVMTRDVSEESADTAPQQENTV